MIGKLFKKVLGVGKPLSISGPKFRNLLGLKKSELSAFRIARAKEFDEKRLTLYAFNIEGTKEVHFNLDKRDNETIEYVKSRVDRPRPFIYEVVDKKGNVFYTITERF